MTTLPPVGTGLAVVKLKMRSPATTAPDFRSAETGIDWLFAEVAPPPKLVVNVKAGPGLSNVKPPEVFEVAVTENEGAAPAARMLGFKLFVAWKSVVPSVEPLEKDPAAGHVATGDVQVIVGVAGA